MSRSKSENRKMRYTNARERADKQSSGFSATFLKIPPGVQMFKAKAGTMLLDIIPFIAGDGNPYADPGRAHWERTFWVHRGVGVNQDWYVCPAKTSKKRCPICEHRMKLMKDADGDNEEMVQSLAPSQRQLFNVINVKEPDKGIQLWEISNHCFGKTLDGTLRAADEDDDWGKFFFLDDGFTLRVSFVEDSFAGTSFVKAERIDFKPRREQYEDDKIEEAHVLDDVLVELEYDELKKIFLSADEEDEDEPKKSKSKRTEEEDDDDDDEPPKKKRAVEEEDDDDEPPKKKKSPKDEDDWDDFDDDDDKSKKKKASEEEEDDEDDDEPPRKKKKVVDEDDWDDDDDEPKKKKKVVEEEDDDEPPKKKRAVEEEEDDDDDEPPKKKKSSDEDEDEDEDAEEETLRRKKKNRFDQQKGDKGWEDEDDDDDEPPKKKSK